jgi:hypothetical protein
VDKVRHPTGKDAKPYIPLRNEDDYRREQSQLYPPDGYYMTKKKRKRGKKEKVPPMENRPYPDEYSREYEKYKAAQKASYGAQAVYNDQRQVFQHAEARTIVPALYTVETRRGRLGNVPEKPPGGLYLPSHHRRMQKPSDNREDLAYR